MTTRPSLLRVTLFGLSLMTAGLMALPAMADPGRQLERISEELELSADQYAEIQGLIDAHRARMDELGLDPETRREGREERHALMQEIQSLLTPEQQQQWMKTRDQRRREHQRHRGRNRLMQTLEGMDLSEDQRASIDALMAEGRQRGQEEREAFMQSLQGILTSEQWDEIEALREARRGQRGRRDR